jgi:hypothetical protein
MSIKKITINLFALGLLFSLLGTQISSGVNAAPNQGYINDVTIVNPITGTAGFDVGRFLSNLIKLLFFIAGLVAMIFMLIGGFEWVMAGGKEDDIKAARGKITNSVIGLVVMVAILFLVGILEQVVFGGRLCMGITCPIKFSEISLWSTTP